MSLNSKSNAMIARMGDKNGGSGIEKPLDLHIRETDQGRSALCLFTCKTSRRHDGHDGGFCATIDSAKSLEKEPILCHFTD